MKYTGKASCVIKQINHPNPNFWTVRFTSIKKCCKPKQIVVGKQQYDSLLEDLERMQSLMNNIKSKLDAMKIDYE